jgi:hypothetical protein
VGSVGLSKTTRKEWRIMAKKVKEKPIVTEAEYQSPDEAKEKPLSRDGDLLVFDKTGYLPVVRQEFERRMEDASQRLSGALLRVAENAEEMAAAGERAAQDSDNALRDFMRKVKKMGV